MVAVVAEPKESTVWPRLASGPDTLPEAGAALPGLRRIYRDKKVKTV